MKRLFSAVFVMLMLTAFAGCEDFLDDAGDALKEAGDVIGDLAGSLEDVEESFDDIANKTGGGRINAKDAADLPTKIKELLSAQSKAGDDVVFLIDKTGSMEDDIDSVKENLTAILEVLPTGTRVALATYGDKNSDGDEWYSTTELTTNYDDIRSEIEGIETTGGGDWEESVYDGLYETMDRLVWQSTGKRMILLIGDAGPLTDDDKTDHSLDDVVDKSKEETPNINIYTIVIEE